MAVGQGADQLEQALGVGEHFSSSVSVHGDVVPGRYDFAVFSFARVKPGADVGVGAGKNDQCFSAVLQLLPLRIGFGEMTVQRSVRPLLGIKQ
ncbi:hypothetical protein D3C72_1920530 [compost metagenome]